MKVEELKERIRKGEFAVEWNKNETCWEAYSKYPDDRLYFDHFVYFSPSEKKWECILDVRDKKWEQNVGIFRFIKSFPTAKEAKAASEQAMIDFLFSMCEGGENEHLLQKEK